MISVDQLILDHYPQLHTRPTIGPAARKMLRTLMCEERVHDFFRRYPYLRGLDFVEQVLEELNFTFAMPDRDCENILSQGRMVMIANHPIGSLDALALIKAVSQVRRDVRVVANKLLLHIEPLQDILLPVHNMSGDTPRACLARIYAHLEDEGALIIFPAGEVSRLGPAGIRDPHWSQGFLRIASATKSPIVPAYIGGRNSVLFYGISMVYKPLSTLLLVREMYRQRAKHVTLRIGQPIPVADYESLPGTREAKVTRFFQHLYRIGRGQQGLFRTQAGIALPESRQEIKRVVDDLEVLGKTDDKIDILLYRSTASCPVMREIGRLREISFRAVGEGTGKRRDVDRFDGHYFHILLWNAAELEIVGAYRLADTAKVMAQQGEEGLYTASLFRFDAGMQPYLREGLELGRSFVQPKYWGRRSLHYLWLGIGAFLARYPGYRYLFGPVSLSPALPLRARDLLVYFYGRHFAREASIVRHRTPHVLSDNTVRELAQIFPGRDYREDFRTLRTLLGEMGLTVPTLYRQYTELCEAGGVHFLDFGADADFGGCIDGFVMVDIHAITREKFERYIGVHQKERVRLAVAHEVVDYGNMGIMSTMDTMGNTEVGTPAPHQAAFLSPSSVVCLLKRSSVATCPLASKTKTVVPHAAMPSTVGKP